MGVLWSAMMTVTGLTLKNPTVLAAGILGTTGASLLRVARGGAGAVVTKSIGCAPNAGHPNPSMVETECGFLNAMGLPNPGYRNYREELSVVRGGRGAGGVGGTGTAEVPVIASVFGADAREFSDVASGLSDLADAIELNLSCPHADRYGASIGIDPALVLEITSAVKDVAPVPVWVKLTPNVTDITEIGLAAEEGGADAVVAINTVRAMAIDIESGVPILGNQFGGLSGAAIKPIAVKSVYDLYGALDIPIIGVGGISCWQDAIEMILAGACAVQIGSAVHNGISVFRDVADGIAEYCHAHGCTVDELCGIAHQR